MSRMTVLATIVAIGFVGGCSAATATSAPSASPTPPAKVAIAAPSASPEVSEVDRVAYALSVTRDDGSKAAIPVSLGAQAGGPIELGDTEVAYAFRIDERGLWVFRSDECGESCVGSWSALDLSTGEETVLATDAAQPLVVEAVDGVIYNTVFFDGRYHTTRLDGAAMPWQAETAVDYAIFSPDESQVWRTVTGYDDPDVTRSFLLAAGAAPTPGDEVLGLSGSIVDWVDDTTVLLAAQDATNTGPWYLFDTETRTESPLPMAASGDFISVEAGGVLAYRQYEEDASRRDTFATASGTVIGSTPQGYSYGVQTASGALIELIIDSTWDEESLRMRLNGAALVDVASGVSTPVAGLSADSLWLGRVAVYSAS